MYESTIAVNFNFINFSSVQFFNIFIIQNIQNTFIKYIVKGVSRIDSIGI